MGQDLAHLREVITVIRMIGSYDLLGLFLAQDRRHLSELVNSRIRAIPGTDSADAELALETFAFRTEWGFLDREAAPPMTGAKANVDQTDVSIIHQLQIDGRVSNRSLAESLGVSEGTIRARIKRLEQERCIRIVAVTDMIHLGMDLFAIMDVEIEPSQLDSTARRICEFPEVQYAASILGRHQLLLGIVALNRADLVDFVDQRLGKLPGIRRTELAEGAQMVKHTFTWCQLT